MTVILQKQGTSTAKAQLQLTSKQFTDDLLQWLMFDSNWNFVRNSSTKIIVRGFMLQYYNAVPDAAQNLYDLYKGRRTLVAKFDNIIKLTTVNGITLQQKTVLQCYSIFLLNPVTSLVKFGAAANMLCRKLAQLKYEGQQNT